MRANDRSKATEPVRWLADENFNFSVVRGLRRLLPDFDIVRAQDAGLTGYTDPMLLAWAAEEGRILLTHDVQTVPNYAYARIERGLAMPGVVQVRRTLRIGLVIEEIQRMDRYSDSSEWEGQVVYLPLR